jgi:molybdopterin-containing oxidoreductase family iron-sulfur binding subunit
MSSNKKYWKSVEELENGSLLRRLEITNLLKQFLLMILKRLCLLQHHVVIFKVRWFSTAWLRLLHVKVLLTSCIQSSWSSDYFCFDGFDFANLLVKTREGRPIKIDNNTISGAKFTARIHASILSLYDNMRLSQTR